MDGDVVLDTSVVIKWFSQGEVLASPSLALRDVYLDGQIAVSAPSLLVYELASILRYKSDLLRRAGGIAERGLYHGRQKAGPQAEDASLRAFPGRYRLGVIVCPSLTC